MVKSKGGRIISILTAVCLTALGLMFIVAVAHLFYTGGETPYSWERVGEYLGYLALPSVITILLILCGIVYNIVTGENEETKAKRTDGELLESFLTRYSLDSFDEKTKARVSAIRKRKNAINLSACMLSSALFVFIIDYLLFIAKFTIENLNDDITSAFAVTLPIGFAAVAIHFVRAYLSERSAKEELAVLKEGLKGGEVKRIEKAEPKPAGKTNSLLIGRLAILAVALVFIILGVFNGGMGDVLAKAVKICTECIGLG